EAQGCAEQNRIKEQQLGLFADRTSSATLRANQLRLYFSSFAYGLRRLGLTGTAFAKAQSTTIRLKLLKIGARLRLTARKVWLSFSEAYPYASDIAQILANLKQHPAWSPPG
ncbi:transposase, partial [Thiolapillus sp.]